MFSVKLKSWETIFPPKADFSQIEITVHHLIKNNYNTDRVCFIVYREKSACKHECAARASTLIT